METLMHGSELEVRGGDIPIDYNEAVGETAIPEELVQLRDKLVAEAEGFNVPKGNTRRPIRRGCGGPPESEGLRMRGKRYVEELGSSHRFLPVGRMVVRSTAIEARKGKPGHRAKGEPKR